MHRTTIALLTILILCASGSIDARECDTELGDFRLELDNFLADYHEAAGLAIRLEYPAAVDFEGHVAELESTLNDISDDQLQELCLLFDRAPSLVETPRVLANAMRVAGFAQDWLPCLESSQQEDLIGWVLAAELAAGIMETAANIIGCLDKWGPACATANTIALVARVAEVILEYILTMSDHACLQEHFDLLTETVMNNLEDVSLDVDAIQLDIDDNLDVAMSTRASQHSVDTVADQLADLEATLGTPRTATITGDIAAINVDLADQEADREAYQDLKLSLSIEFQLQPGRTGQIASLRLPSAFGGQLEAVRETVATAITMHINAGQSINNAMYYFNLADGYFNGGVEYDLAFENYRLAYQQAVMLSADE